MNRGRWYGRCYFRAVFLIFAMLIFGGCSEKKAAGGTDVSAVQKEPPSVPVISEPPQSFATASPQPSPAASPQPSPSAEAPWPSPVSAVPQGEAKDIESIYLQLGSRVTASVGEIGLPVFVIDFPDMKYAEKMPALEEMQEQVFGEKGNSAASYYGISSGGRLKMEGDVYLYTAKKNIGEYETYKGVEQLVVEALDFYDGEVDFSRYDRNEDGTMDALMITVPKGGDPDFWWGVTATWGDCGEDSELHDYEVDGIRLCRYIINDIQPWDLSYWAATLEHEMGHCMGLPDYYKYDYSKSQGLQGVAGLEMMDDSKGDFCQFSKLQLGWLREDQVQVMPADAQEASFVLPPAGEGGCVLVFPEGQEPDYQSEYFLIEYDTPEGLQKGLIGKGGVRILHVQAELITEGRSAVNLYRYGNFSQYYDRSERGIRVLRLVNNGGGFYHEGDVVSYGTINFGWYDKADGKQIVDPGFQIFIGAEEADGVEIKIQRD